MKIVYENRQKKSKKKKDLKKYYNNKKFDRKRDYFLIKGQNFDTQNT